MAETWFTSDLHLGHANILKHQLHRAALFDSIECMDAAIIDSINQYVERTDELWILGDFCWKASKAGHYRQRLKVKKLHIVAGNHDSSSLRTHVSSYSEILYRRFDKINFHLCHYPILSWRNREHGSIHLYGHCHGTREAILNEQYPNRKAQDVGIDYAYMLHHDFRPFSLTELLLKFNEKGQ